MHAPGLLWVLSSNPATMERASSSSKSHVRPFPPGTIPVSHLITSISPFSQCKKKKNGDFSVSLHFSSTTDPPKERRKYFLTIKHYTHTLPQKDHQTSGCHTCKGSCVILYLWNMNLSVSEPSAFSRLMPSNRLSEILDEK